MTTVLPTENIPTGFSTLQTVAGTTLRIVRRDSLISVNGFPIRQADILVSTGILHTVDDLFLAAEVPTPPTPQPPPRPKGKGKGKGNWQGMMWTMWKGGMWKGKGKPAPMNWNMGMGNYGKNRNMGNYPKPQYMGYPQWMSKQRYRSPPRMPHNIFMRAGRN